MPELFKRESMEDLELIHKYIKGEIEDTLKINEIETRLSSDRGFRELFDQERVVLAGIREAEKNRLKDDLKQVRLNNKQSGLSIWMKVAAALIPLVIVGYLLIPSSKDYQAIYSEYYEAYGVYEFGQTRSDAEFDSFRDEVFNLYEQENYEDALDGLQLLFAEQPRDGYLLYMGICQMELGKYSEAIKSFDQIRAETDYLQIGLWYKSLALLNLERIEEARTILEELTMTNNGLSVKATQVLDLIE